MKSIRLKKTYKEFIYERAMDAIRAKYTTKKLSIGDIYKDKVIKDVNQRMEVLLEQAREHNIVDLIEKDGWGKYLAEGINLNPTDVIFLPQDREFYKPYEYNGKFHQRFKTKVALAYQPMLDANEATYREEQAKVQLKEFELNKLLDSVNTTKQLEAAWTEAPEYYPSELREERNP
jgi:hypothetical protein